MGVGFHPCYGTMFQEEKQKASTKMAAAPKETSAEAALYREGTVLW